MNWCYFWLVLFFVFAFIQESSSKLPEREECEVKNCEVCDL